MDLPSPTKLSPTKLSPTKPSPSANRVAPARSLRGITAECGLLAADAEAHPFGDPVEAYMHLNAAEVSHFFCDLDRE